jgi:adenine-specific DNA glycosylase
VRAEIHYGLAQRERRGAGEVLLHQRPASASVMPGMWELPQIEPRAKRGAPPRITVRHAIMQTNYIAAVSEIADLRASRTGLKKTRQRWIKVADLPSLPLTGLARKVFARLGLLDRP